MLASSNVIASSTVCAVDTRASGSEILRTGGDGGGGGKSDTLPVRNDDGGRLVAFKDSKYRTRNLLDSI